MNNFLQNYTLEVDVNNQKGTLNWCKSDACLIIKTNLSHFFKVF